MQGKTTIASVLIMTLALSYLSFLIVPTQFASAAVAFVDHDTVTSTSASSCAMTIPAGAGTGDLMIAFTFYSENATAEVWDDDGGGGQGWTQLDYNSDTIGRDRETAIYYKVHDGSETDPTFTVGGGSPLSCSLLVYSGNDTTTPFDVVYDSGSHHTAGNDDTTPTNAAITTATDGAMVVLFHAATHDDISASGVPSGYTLRDELVPGSSHNHKQIFVAELLVASATTETPGAWTHTSSPTNVSEFHTYTLAIRPAGAGPSDTCTAPVTGDWQVRASDNCYIDTDQYAQGTILLINDDGPGSFNIIDGATVAGHGLESTSTPINVESGTGATIQLDNQ